MNNGTTMVVDTPQNIKSLMRGEVLELICPQVREAVNLLKGSSVVMDVQAFGDRINIIVNNAAEDLPAIHEKLRQAGIELSGWRTINPSLENIFISLMTGQLSPGVTNDRPPSITGRG